MEHSVGGPVEEAAFFLSQLWVAIRMGVDHASRPDRRAHLTPGGALGGGAEALPGERGGARGESADGSHRLGVALDGEGEWCV